MINSRDLRTSQDGGSCAKCVHLRYDPKIEGFKCGIDGEIMPHSELMTMTVCGCFKEVRKNGKLQHRPAARRNT